MKWFRREQKGFTLMEVMVALGISSVLVMAIMNAQKTSEESMGNIKRNNEINELIQTLTAELSKDEVCSRNFAGFGIARTGITLVNKQGGTLLATGPYSPETKQGGTKANLNIVSIATSAGTGSKMNLTVTYRQLVKGWENPSANETFVLPINVYLKNALITSCYSELQTTLELAVQAACQGEGARWYAADTTYPYGRCEHEVEIKNAAGTVLPPTAGAFACPAGQVLRNINTSVGKMSFECTTIGTNSACPAWSYLRGMNSDGTPNCVDIRTLFPNAGFMVVRGGTLTVQTLDCNVYGAGRVLQRINADGSLVCVNPRLSVNCPENQYASGGINADGTVTCSYAGDSSCAAGQYIKEITAAGSVVCGWPYVPGSCGAGTVANGMDSSGNLTCVAVPN